MGAGNWSMRSKRFDTETWHVDANRVSFEEYGESALDALREAVKRANPEISEEALKDVSFSTDQDFESEIEGLDQIMADVWSEFPFLGNQAAYYSDVGEDRHVDLMEGLQSAVANAVGDRRDYSELRKAMDYEECEAEPHAPVMGLGKLTQVVLMSWQDYYCIGIGPRNELADRGHLFDSKDAFDNKDANAHVETLLSRCMAALDPDNPKLAAYRTPLAPIELRAHETLKTGGEGNIELLDAVVRRAAALAETLESECDVLDERYIQFQAGFGVEPSEFSLLRDSIDEYLEFAEQFGMTPGMAEIVYGEELSRMKDAVLNFMAVNQEDVYRPDGAWTSKKTDLSPYRHAAAIQLGAQAVALIKSGSDNALMQALEQDPSRVSLMRESDFDASLASAVEAACPIMSKPFPESEMLTLYEPNSAMPNHSGVLVWRGHLDWGHFDQKMFDAASQKMLDDGAGFELGDLPQWMTLLTLNEDFRETLANLDLPPEVAKPLYAEDGCLAVTGVLAETGNGQIRALYVTTSDRPMDLMAPYEPIVLNGLVKAAPAPAPAPDAEVSHGQ